MSDLIIKNTKMPDDCMSCFARHWLSNTYTSPRILCRISGEISETPNTRGTICPLEIGQEATE